MFATKTKWFLGLGVVFILILATNLVDRTNFRWMSQSVTTIYQDRLVAKGLVYDMRSILADKQLALARRDAAYFGEPLREDQGEIDALLAEFSTTKLTPTEEQKLDSLKRRYATMTELEQSLVDAPDDPFADTGTLDDLREAHEAVVADLFDLSRIQLAEGKRAQAAATQTMGAIDVVTQIEIALLAAIGVLMVLALVFGPRTSDD